VTRPKDTRPPNAPPVEWIESKRGVRFSERRRRPWRRRNQAADRAPRTGRSGGFRTLIVFRAGARVFFVHGFAKNEKDNIGQDELSALKKVANALLAYDDKAIARVIASGNVDGGDMR
jgi:hypothetical protein